VTVGGGLAGTAADADGDPLGADAGGLDPATVDAASAGVGKGSGAGGLLVARSTVTLRTGSGVLAGSRCAIRLAGLGPDNNSGTINTSSNTKIDAPTGVL